MRRPSRLFRAPLLDCVVGASLALASDGGARRAEPAVSLIRDTEIEAIIHQDADPIFAAAGLDPKSVQDLHDRRQGAERLLRRRPATSSSTPA